LVGHSTLRNRSLRRYLFGAASEQNKVGEHRLFEKVVSRSSFPIAREGSRLMLCLLSLLNATIITTELLLKALWRESLFAMGLQKNSGA
jgi:hypothetical protein